MTRTQEDKDLDHVLDVAAHFATPTQTIARVEPYGSGNINDTYRVSLASDDGGQFILQRINQNVFPYPKLIMANLRIVLRHADAKDAALAEGRRWELPQVLSTREGQDYVIDERDEFWRGLSYIEGATAYPEVRDAQHAAEAGYALGRFQRLINDVDTDVLHDTLPGFHIMPHYLAHYEEVVAAPERPISPEVRQGMDFIDARKAWAPVLEDARAAGQLRRRPIHGDPKIDNIMIDNETGCAVSVIDLDTVKPGLVQYDIGDCLRSSCNPLGEHTHEIDQVTFELDLCEAILRGYLPEVEDFYTPKDYAYIFDGVRVLAFEMGLRFFTDYLEGDVYFKTRSEEHNLRRALVQFKLTESIEAQEREIRRMVRSMVGT
jgi:Ser/Thr protein kinase RdoA (MazF antagonist)